MVAPVRVGLAMDEKAAVGILTKPAYLRRLDDRARRAALKRCILFGLVLGWPLALIGAFRYCFVPGVVDSLWLAVTLVGLLLLTFSLILPGALDPAERAWMAVAHAIGRVVFSTVLTVVYVCFILPVGRVLRWMRGEHPFYRWSDGAKIEAEGWVRKEVITESQRTSSRQRPVLVQPFVVLGHFLRSGQYLLLPTLVLLLILGLLLFFVQSSALAPFIYTIF